MSIRLRQPLRYMKIKDRLLENCPEFIELIKTAVNVKEIIFDPTIKGAVELCVEVDDELLEEGILNDLSRNINQARKCAGLGVDNVAKYEIKIKL